MNLVNKTLKMNHYKLFQPPKDSSNVAKKYYIQRIVNLIKDGKVTEEQYMYWLVRKLVMEKDYFIREHYAIYAFKGLPLS